MSDVGIEIEQRALRFERLLPGPIERVWKFLTESEERGRWLAPGNWQLYSGGRAELNFKHSSLSDAPEPVPERFKAMENGATLTCRILECDAPRLLRLSWGDSAEASEVTFELTPRGDEVLLVLTHRRLGARKERIIVSAGWHTHLGILTDALNDRSRRPFWSSFAASEAEYERRAAEAATGDAA